MEKVNKSMKEGRWMWSNDIENSNSLLKIKIFKIGEKNDVLKVLWLENKIGRLNENIWTIVEILVKEMMFCCGVIEGSL